MMLGCVGNVSLPQETLIRGMTRYSAPTAVVAGAMRTIRMLWPGDPSGAPGPWNARERDGGTGFLPHGDVWAVRAAVLADRGPDSERRRSGFGAPREVFNRSLIDTRVLPAV